MSLCVEIFNKKLARSKYYDTTSVKTKVSGLRYGLVSGICSFRLVNTLFVVHAFYDNSFIVFQKF